MVKWIATAQMTDGVSKSLLFTETSSIAITEETEMFMNSETVNADV